MKPTSVRGIGVIRALICEDEPIAREALREYLKDVDWMEIVGEAESGSAALRAIQKLEPDLVFMDVQLPGMSGVDVLEAASHKAAIVFTTAFDEYAISAFDLGAVDYLLKPFGKARLLETLARVRIRLVAEAMAHDPAAGTTSRWTERVFGRRRGSVIPVPTVDLIRAESTVTGVILVTPQGSLDADCTLLELERRLNPGDFIRIHRSHLVNLAHVGSIRRHDERRLSVRMSDGSSIVASRQGSKTLRAAMA